MFLQNKIERFHNFDKIHELLNDNISCFYIYKKKDPTLPRKTLKFIK